MNSPGTSCFKVIVDKREVLADDVVVFELRDPAAGPLPAFTAGAHVEVLLGRGSRHYSLCNDPRDRSLYRIGVHRVATGRGGSIELFDTVVEGSELFLLGPFNHFALTPGSAPPLLIAGGIGVTPILAMALELRSQGRSFECHYSGRHLRRMAFTDLWRQGRLGADSHLHADDGEGAPPMQLGEVIRRHEAGRHLYVCGPEGLIRAVCESARQRGWPDDHVHFERFGGAAPAHREDDGGFEVQIASSGRCIRVGPDQTVADALMAAGIHIPVSCGAGVCGSCRIRIVSGEPDHRDLFYTPAEQARGDEFTPCCSRARSPRLVLDL